MKIRYLFLTLMLSFCVSGCAIGPATSNYTDGNNLEFKINEIHSIRVEMRLGKDSGHIVLNTTSESTIKVIGEDNARDDYNFRYFVSNKKLYIREASIGEGEYRPESALQKIEFQIPENFTLDNFYFTSANSVLEVNNVKFNTFDANANGKQILLNNVKAQKIYAKTWTGGHRFINVEADEIYLSTTYADMNLTFSNLPNKLECIATSGHVNINLPKDATNFTVYPGKQDIELRFEYILDTYEEGDVTKNKYIVGDGEKEIHYSGKDNHLHILPL